MSLCLCRRGIHNDETRFSNPRSFTPERYADDLLSSAEAALIGDPSKRDHFIFGAGRRVCQGIHIAERSLFLAISRLLWAFNFEIAEDEEGKRMVPDQEKLTEGLLVLPQKFLAKIVPRSEEKAKQVKEEWTKVESKLNENGQWKSIPEGMFFKEYIPLES